jgi:flagellar biosynthesis protein FlhF
MIPTRIQREIPRGEKKIMMFVGPTGVGKTTTLAKLAAKYSFLEYKNRVGIITLDTYRIGALEQLFQYAKMLKLPIEDVTDSIDFERALQELALLRGKIEQGASGGVD